MIDECIEDTAKFKKHINRNKVHLFETDNKTFKLQGKGKEISAISLMKNLFGSISFFSVKQRINVRQVLKYPLTQMPV